MNSYPPCSQAGRQTDRQRPEWKQKPQNNKNQTFGTLEDNLPALLWLPSQSSGICAEGLNLLQHLMARHPGLERSQTGVAQCL